MYATYMQKFLTNTAGFSKDQATFLMLAGVLFESAHTSISAVAKAELVPTTVRSRGVALPYALANAAFGGTAQYIALWFETAGAERG